MNRERVKTSAKRDRNGEQRTKKITLTLRRSHPLRHSVVGTTEWERVDVRGMCEGRHTASKTSKFYQFSKIYFSKTVHGQQLNFWQRVQHIISFRMMYHTSYELQLTPGHSLVTEFWEIIPKVAKLVSLWNWTFDYSIRANIKLVSLWCRTHIFSFIVHWFFVVLRLYFFVFIRIASTHLHYFRKKLFILIFSILIHFTACPGWTGQLLPPRGVPERYRHPGCTGQPPSPRFFFQIVQISLNFEK